MEAPLVYPQLINQLYQWIVPKDYRHRQGFAHAVAAILHSQSACFS
ncbi:hypothetical protein [Moorena sp. SIO3I6]|nr:hypothetical protein [Moorena sp. SIO3I6]NEP28095.1 hypothetical protein [Moorena sp. SIO3I6]